MADTTILDLDNMLNETLDAIPEAPDYCNPPAGEYILLVKDCGIDKYTTKKEPDIEKQRMKLTYSVVQTISTAANEQPVPDSTLFTETFMATEQGLSYFKKQIKNIMGASDVTGVTLGDMMNSVKGSQFSARLSIRKSKGVDGTEYENLQIRVVQAS